MQRTEQSTSFAPRDLPRLLTARDLEQLLQIDIKTVYRYVQRGLIPYVRIQSNVRFRREEILEWIEAQSFSPFARSYRKSA